MLVRSRPLSYDRGRLFLGPEELETATSALHGVGPAAGLRPGEWVGLHWGWVCDRLTPRQLGNLRRFTLRHLQIVNARLEHSGPALTLG